ncbi:GntR family transcriptional regulator [Clostridium sp. 001]|uniref:GntR family transcriptional regulator n=1 Tax=Clostridium sp. 001 TaxID=1970093 RepID=UPI001C2BFCF4|nr:GntR family transcriptional regulator [Clostridium sp. 001]QXE17637.1 GntR family transcriptional regulator [Clostridium sp. 001]
MLNRNSLVPLYAQLQRIIRDSIINEIYKDGEKIPSESEFVEKYSITRTTIRKAISNLVNEGLLYKVHGKGTFVSLRKTKYNVWNFSGFTDYITKRQETPVSKVLESKIINEGGEKFFKLVRARGVEKENHICWLTLDTSITPLSVFHDINKYDFSRKSLYTTMKEEYGVMPKTAALTISGIKGNSTTKSVFNHEEDAVLTKAEGNVKDVGGIVIERVSVIYGPDIDFKIVTNI